METAIFIIAAFLIATMLVLVSYYRSRCFKYGVRLKSKRFLSLDPKYGTLNPICESCFFDTSKINLKDESAN